MDNNPNNPNQTDDNELDYSEYEIGPAADGNGQHDPAEGCSYCGYWQCDGTCGHKI
jgi:hypothetical protein